MKGPCLLTSQLGFFYDIFKNEKVMSISNLWIWAFSWMIWCDHNKCWPRL